MKYFCVNFKYMLLLAILISFFISKLNISFEETMIYSAVVFTTMLVLALIPALIKLFSKKSSDTLLLPVIQYIGTVFLLFPISIYIVRGMVPEIGQYYTNYVIIESLALLFASVFALAWLKTSKEVSKTEFWENFLKEIPLVFIVFEALFYLKRRQTA